MLNKLQSNIESEEKRWQTQIQLKETEISNLRVEINDLQKKASNSEVTYVIFVRLLRRVKYLQCTIKRIFIIIDT
jgi:hypothetical protein